MTIQNRLFWQIWLTASAIALVSAGVFYTTFVTELEDAYLDRAEQHLVAQMPFAALLAREMILYEPRGSYPYSKSTLANSATRMTVIGLDGAVIFDSVGTASEMESHAHRPEVLQAASSGQGKAIRFSHTLLAELLYIAEQLEVESAGQVVKGYVRLATPIDLIDGNLASLRQQMLVVMGLTFLVLLAISYALSRHFNQPIAAAAGFAGEIASGHYDSRLPGIGKSDSAVLEQSLNEVARKTQERLVNLEVNRARLAGVLSALKEGVLALDEHQVILHMNKSVAGMLDLPSDSIGRPVWEVVRLASVVAMIDQCVEHREDISSQIVSGDRSFEISVSLMNKAAGIEGGLIVVFQDVTQRAQLDQIRVDFVSDASHELKTPLSSIKGMVETIIDDPEMDPEVRLGFLGKVSVQVERLVKIVAELLELSRYDRASLSPEHFMPVDITNICRQVGVTYSAEVPQPAVNLEVTLPEGPVTVKGDSLALHQLVTNLVDNALKYSPAGATVKLSVVAEDNAASVLVQDSGPGIAEEHHGKIFLRFYRVDPARSRSLGGTGLGLSIVKQIATAHAGKIELESRPGHGSAFTFVIPRIVS